MDSDNYPESCHAIYIVNGGMVFGAVWRMLSPFVDKGTRDKVHVLGHARTKGVLGKACGGIDKVPDFLGGGLNYDATRVTWLADMDRIMAGKARAAEAKQAAAAAAAAAVAGNGVAPPAAAAAVTGEPAAAVEIANGEDGSAPKVALHVAAPAAAVAAAGAVVVGAAAAKGKLSLSDPAATAAVAGGEGAGSHLTEKIATVPVEPVRVAHEAPQAAATAGAGLHQVPQQLSAGSGDGGEAGGAGRLGQLPSAGKAAGTAAFRAAVLEPPKGLAEIKARKDSGGDSFADADEFSTPKSHMSR